LSDPAIVVRDLRKTFRTPFRRKKVEALRGVTFTVERGQIFGFVGPNGAGKTTTIRTLMGLIKPTAGSVSILGEPIPSRAARRRVGFLPEAPYFYDYLTVGELLDLAGRLFGMPAAARKRRADELIEKVGLGRARAQSLKKFSKGMLQRAGLAQALMNDPEVVVLDEPMSGLDPIGRKEVRDLILELRDQGKTVFFSTHILTDVEAITCRRRRVDRARARRGREDRLGVAAPRDARGPVLARGRERGLGGFGGTRVIGRLWAIALNTFREAVRIRVMYGILVLVVGVNLMTLVLGQMATNEEARVTRDVGLASISLFGSLTAIFLGVFLLYTEVQRRTIHAIVSKPIERWEFVVGKYLGMALVLSVLVGLFAVAMVLMLATQGIGISDAILEGIVLAWLEVLTVAAIAIFFSSFSTPFLSGIFALALWGIGRITPDLEAATRDASPAISWTTKLTLQIVPDLHLFAVSGRALDGTHVSIHGDFVSWGYVGLAALHGLGWIVGLLAFAALLFQRRDFA